MKSSQTRKPIFERLRQGLTEGIEHSRGELTLRATVLPNHPPEFSPEELTALRARVEMSQAVFARVLSVSTKTVQSWEQGTRKPSPSSRRLIQLIQANPGLVFQAVGMNAPPRP
jgi:putative transcriptional regulator